MSFIGGKGYCTYWYLTEVRTILDGIKWPILYYYFNRSHQAVLGRLGITSSNSQFGTTHRCSAVVAKKLGGHQSHPSGTQGPPSSALELRGIKTMLGIEFTYNRRHTHSTSGLSPNHYYYYQLFFGERLYSQKCETEKSFES